jgi:hypothetical protein
MVDWPPLGAPGVNVTEAVCVTGVPPAVAVYATVSAVVSPTENVATPAAFVAAEDGVIVDEPEPAASETTAPLSGWSLRSRTVTVTVDAVVPSAVTDAGDADTDECDAETAPGTNATPAVCVTVTPSAGTDAVYVVDSTVASCTLNVAWPEASVVEERAVIVEEPPLFASATVFPAIAFEFASRIVTVTVDAEEPSASTEAGDATTEEVPASGVVVANPTVAVCATVMASLASVAV